MIFDKRIIGAIILKEGKAVQSFEFENYRPLGSAICCIENLDRWRVDEIIILDIDRSEKKLGPNLDLIRTISSIPISTPLIYAGGIKTVDDATNIIAAGAERIVIDSLLNETPEMLKDISDAVGVQSIVASLPVKIKNNNIFHYNYISKNLRVFDQNLISLINKYTSEILLIDIGNQGKKDSFNLNIFDYIECLHLPIICYGGIGLSNRTDNISNQNKIGAAALGNILNYKELSIN